MPVFTNVTRAAKAVLARTHALDLVSRWGARDQTSIFLYHGFCEGSRSPQRLEKLLPIETFEEHLRIFKRYGRPVRLQDLANGNTGGIALTFDDGYRSNFDLAFPVLQRYDFPATIFITTGFVDRKVPLWSDWLEFLVHDAPAATSAFVWGGFTLQLEPGRREAERTIAACKRHLRRYPIAAIHEFLRALESHWQLRYTMEDAPDLLRPLEWEDVLHMRASGLVSFGAHTVSHPVLSRCDESVQEFEIAESKRRMEAELGEPCTMFAYPHGGAADYGEATCRIVRDAGFRLAVSTNHGFNRFSGCDWYGLKRWGGGGGPGELSYLAAGGPAVACSVREYFGPKERREQRCEA